MLGLGRLFLRVAELYHALPDLRVHAERLVVLLPEVVDFFEFVLILHLILLELVSRVNKPLPHFVAGLLRFVIRHIVAFFDDLLLLNNLLQIVVGRRVISLGRKGVILQKGRLGRGSFRDVSASLVLIAGV